MRSLHEALRTPFTPDAVETPAHGQLLQAMWRAMVPNASFEPVSAEWKRIGFQGSDPRTDVRGGGWLAVQCIAHFATLHTIGYLAMLQDLHGLESEGAGFYPVSTTAIVLCSRLCDVLGLSAGMRGPVSEADLEALLAAPPPSEMCAALRAMLPDA